MSELPPAESQPASGYKLLAYNTSFVNDCHENQFHGGLSESASIIAKIAKLNGKSYDNLIDMINAEQETYSPLLKDVRTKLAEASTKYIESKIDNGYDFLALIEQSMHVKKTNSANYDPVMNNKLDFGEENINYGIMRRLQGIHPELIEDLDNDLTINNIGIKTYNIVYDNVANPDISAGEGIAIIYKKSLVDKVGELLWNPLQNPSYLNILKVKNDEKNKNNINLLTSLRPTKNIHFYSADLGPAICKDETGKIIYTKNAKNAPIDNGRPFIMTGGTTDSGKKLNLFIAAHGPNIMNLALITEYNENGSVKLLQDSMPVGISFKELDATTLIDVFTKVHALINKCIQDGIEAITNPDLLKNVTSVQVFLGGDLNDPRGLILEKLIENDLLIKLPNIEETFKIKFNYTLGGRSTVGDENPNNITEAGYPELISGCANTDSLKGGVRNLNAKSALGLVGIPVGQDVTKNKAALIDRINYINKNYPKTEEDQFAFIDPENFGYNGDYALFGTSVENPPVYSMVVSRNGKDTNYNLQTVSEGENTVIASDHLPVLSVLETEVPGLALAPATAGGRRTRRRRRRSTRSNKRKSSRGKSRRYKTRR